MHYTVYCYQMTTKYDKGYRSVYSLTAHIVFVTKYRKKVLKAGMGGYLKRKVLQVGKFHPEIEIIEVNTDSDHIHVLASIPPKAIRRTRWWERR